MSSSQRAVWDLPSSSQSVASCPDCFSDVESRPAWFTLSARIIARCWGSLCLRTTPVRMSSFDLRRPVSCPHDWYGQLCRQQRMPAVHTEMSCNYPCVCACHACRVPARRIQGLSSPRSSLSLAEGGYHVIREVIGCDLLREVCEDFSDPTGFPLRFSGSKERFRDRRSGFAGFASRITLGPLGQRCLSGGQANRSWRRCRCR